MKIWFFTACFFVILTALAALNYRLNGQFGIETVWLALGLAPLVIWMLASGRLSEFNGFGLAFKLKEATRAPVSLAVDGERVAAGDPVVPEAISSGSKGGIDLIDQLIGRRVQAITLTAGRQGYYSNWAIEKYLERLTPQPLFRHVLITDAAGRFAALADPVELLEALRADAIDLVALLEQGQLEAIPGASVQAIPADSSKAEALRMMDRHGLARVPVVDVQGHFTGVVERDKVTSSVLAQLVSSLA